MNIIWTDEAKSSYKETIANILDLWNVDIAIKVENEVNTLISNLESHKHLCPASKTDKKLRRCVVSKQTSLLYEIKGDNLYLVSFFANKSNHKHF